MNTLTQLTLGAVLGLGIAYSGCRDPPVPQTRIIYLDTILRNDDHKDTSPDTTSPEDSYTSLETTLATTISEVPDTSVPNETTIEATIEATIDSYTGLETTSTNNDANKETYIDAVSADLSQEVTSTSTTSSPRENIWYAKIGSILKNKNLSSKQQQEQLWDILNNYINKHGGEIFVKVKYDSSIKTPRDVCYRSLSEVFNDMGINNEETNFANSVANYLRKLRFVHSLMPSLCQNDTVTYDPDNPLVRFKAN
ncbi:hypothetical protein HYX11_02940 [Candidatus Woesearchaeota archaeon]|nr:hypothetical protein [Candidatus Woesearchaeota archaeon]